MTYSRRDFMLPASLALGGSSLPASARAAEWEVRLYEVRHRFAEELLPLAQDLMGERGTATPHSGGNSILLVGPAEDLARTLSVLLVQDRAQDSLGARPKTRRDA
ncbi:MAG: hypothetical protein JRG96_01150 [Deltaproteobacteria bacterium]|nr:hypothetical protein [Deltaproteobacteria bacterium]MBW2417321.1 hypothetical protein [Deltaproteobacteria bacterium]